MAMPPAVARATAMSLRRKRCPKKSIEKIRTKTGLVYCSATILALEVSLLPTVKQTNFSITAKPTVRVSRLTTSFLPTSFR